MEREIVPILKEILKHLALQKEVLSLEEFCLYTGISKAYAYKLTVSRKIKFYRPLGKMLFFNKEDVIDFLKQNPSFTQQQNKLKVYNYILNK
jgi:excisionase family DNA binding protein